MKQIRRIMWATDFTKAAEDALKTALSFCQMFRSEIILVHVMPTIEYEPLNKENIKKEALKKLEEIENRIKAQGAVETERLALFGIPFDGVVDQADIHDVGLIFIGSGGSGKSKDLIGITAKNIIRVSEKPVWLVKKGARPTVSRILCPVDFSDPSRRALHDAVFLAKEYGAELTVLTVIENLKNVYYSMAAPAANISQGWVRHERSRFLQFLRDFDLENVTWKKVSRQGKPADEILKAAGELESDLIVMGSLGRTGLSKILLGSTTEKVVRHVPCSILVTKREGISGQAGSLTPEEP